MNDCANSKSQNRTQQTVRSTSEDSTKRKGELVNVSAEGAWLKRTYGTWHYQMNSGGWIPVESHRVTQQHLRFRSLEAKFPTTLSAVANQCVDVLWQTQQLAIWIFYLQLQQVAAALEPVHSLHHINNTHQFEAPAGQRRWETQWNVCHSNLQQSRKQCM